jgi:hypothetical protein
MVTDRNHRKTLQGEGQLKGDVEGKGVGHEVRDEQILLERMRIWLKSIFAVFLYALWHLFSDLEKVLVHYGSRVLGIKLWERIKMRKPRDPFSS